MHETKIKYNILIIIGLFIIIYNPPILPVNTTHLVGLCSIMYLAFYYISNKEISFEYRFLKLIGFFILLFAYLFFVSEFNFYGELSSAIFPLYFIIDILPFGYAVKVYGEEKNYSTEDYIKYFIVVAVIQAVLAIGAYIYKPMQIFFLNAMISRGYGDIVIKLGSHRMYGFAASLTYATPIFQSFMSVIVLYFAQLKKENRYRNMFLSIILLLSGVINARTAIVVFMCGFIILVLLGRYSVTNKIVTIISCIFAIAIISILFPYIDRFIASDNMDWITSGFNEILNFIKGNRNQGYFAYLMSKNVYVMPDNILFGEGHGILKQFQDVYSDIGFVNDIWCGGIIYLVVTYAYWMKICYQMFRNRSEIISFIGIFIALTFLLVNIKGPIFSSNDLFNSFIMIYVMTCMEKG